MSDLIWRRLIQPRCIYFGCLHTRNTARWRQERKDYRNHEGWRRNLARLELHTSLMTFKQTRATRCMFARRIYFMFWSSGGTFTSYLLFEIHAANFVWTTNKRIFIKDLVCFTFYLYVLYSERKRRSLDTETTFVSRAPEKGFIAARVNQIAQSRIEKAKRFCILHSHYRLTPQLSLDGEKNQQTADKLLSGSCRNTNTKESFSSVLQDT